MSFQAVAVNVMIASPGDVQIERNIVRELVHEWNSLHAETRKAVLLPVSWETHSTPLMGNRPQATINNQVLKRSDLLIAAFWTRIGTPTGTAKSGTVEEIEEHIKADKPALLYFSSVPVKPDSVDAEQYAALTKYKEECKSRDLYRSYEDANGFRDLVRQHLALTMNEHPYFVDLLKASEPSNVDVKFDVPDIPDLSREARELLLQAVEGDSRILVLAWLGGSSVQTNGKNFVEPGNPRSRATWEGAVRELVENGFLEDMGHKGEVFGVTKEGYDASDLLKSASN